MDSKIIADGDCSHEVKRRLLIGIKAMSNLDSVLKISRDIALPTKVCLVKALVFPVAMHRCESWTIKKAEHWRIDAFELWCWRRPLRVPWTARKSNQSILKEISPEYLLKGLMLKLKLQYFGYLMGRTDSPEKTLMLGKIEGGRIMGTTEDEMVGWHHRLDGHEFEQTLGFGDGQGGLACCGPWGCKQSDTTERQVDEKIKGLAYNRHAKISNFFPTISSQISFPNWSYGRPNEITKCLCIVYIKINSN